VSRVCPKLARSLLLAALPLAAGACSHTPARAEPAAPGTAVLPLPGPGMTLGLRARLLGSPHAYFRFTNADFSRAVCHLFENVMATQPAVTLHGDAHVEQYAVTDLGRGLTDFDDSSQGPAAMDLVRFGVSLRLAAEERGWPGAGEASYAAFLRGYRATLENPTTEAPEPALVARVRRGFNQDRMACLARNEALIDKLEEGSPPADESTMAQAVRTLAANSNLPESFFRKKRGGALRMGIGSALNEKYLVRVEGPTDTDDDDVLLEVKQIREPTGVDCVRSTPGPSRIFVGQARIAYEPFRFPGVFHVGAKTFWIHAWPDNYAELDIHRTLDSPRDLEEIAYDVGVQLGRGHPGGLAEEPAAKLRRAVLRSLPEAQLEEAVRELFLETVAAWERFRSAPPPAS
jgi:Uncharacterized protein conserved in bacteria (DUF2252)